MQNCGHANGGADLADQRGTDRHVIGLGRRGVNGADADVVGAFLFRRDGLVEAMGRFADEDALPACVRASATERSSWPT